MKLYLLSLIFILFSNEIAFGQILIPYRVGDKWGYSDEQENLVIDLRYEEAGRFRTAIAWVKLNNKFGFIDKKGSLKTAFLYDEVSYWGFNSYKVKRDDKIYCVNYQGNEIDCIYGCGGTLDVGYTIDTFKMDRKIGILKGNRFSRIVNNKKINQEATEAIWDDFKNNYAGYAGVKKNNKWGIINKEGELISELKYDTIETESKYAFNKSHYFIFRINGKYGFLDKEGKEIIKPIYTNVDFFERCEFYSLRLAKVWINDAFYGYIDETGKEYFKREEK